MKTLGAICFGAIGLGLPLVLLGQTPPDQVPPSTANKAHLKAAALSLLMYAADYDGVFPYAQSTGGVVAVTKPYIRDVTLWWPVNGGRLIFNPSLAGVSQTAVPKPAGTILIYRDTPESDGGHNAVFADGRAKLTPDADWKGVEQTLRLSLPTIGKPLPANLGQQYNTTKVPNRN